MVTFLRLLYSSVLFIVSRTRLCRTTLTLTHPYTHSLQGGEMIEWEVRWVGKEAG